MSRRRQERRTPVDAAAVAGFAGAIIGGAATLLGTTLAARQHARREREKWLRDRKESAYGNTIRYLLRASNRRSEFKVEGGKLVSLLAKEHVRDLFDDLVEAQYWLAVLTTACGKEQVATLERTSRDFSDLVTAMTSGGLGGPGGRKGNLLDLQDYYTVVLDCARQDLADMGFPRFDGQG
jgi:hypothetical protein